MASSEARPLLLDVNALLALAWPNHQFHTAVLTRLEQQPVPRWATCALTQLGFAEANNAILLTLDRRVVPRGKTHAHVEILEP